MAQGTLTLFNEFAESIADGRIDLDTHTFKIAITSLQAGGTPTIAATDAVPCWGAGGSTNLSSSEVSAGGGYTAGGETLGSVTWSQSSGVGTFDAANVTWTSSGSGDPTNCKTAVIYSDTATNKDAVGFVDLTSDGTTAVSMLTGNIAINWNASGLFSVTVNA
ncbi:MAG: hypothetical protein MI864_00305 [Pseudomonadales bacterium]|nr:hypothetical protein [Pseudomonadales bacterium]